MSFSIPIAFLFFNRPETTQRVWNAIKKIKPTKLYLFADAPRINRPEDVEKVNITRKITETIDWPCEIIRNYAKENEGDFWRTYHAFETVFKTEPYVIWIEDDCLPCNDFFYFCEAMLHQHQNNPQITYINGSNLNWGHPKINSDYYISRYMLPWGFAIWKRSWEYFKPTLEYWTNPTTQKKVLETFTTHEERTFWTQLFNQLYNDFEGPNATKRKSALDYYFKLALWAHQTHAIMPRVNLVKNIGFGNQATHTQEINKSHIVPIKSLNIQNLKEPLSLEPIEEADNWTFQVYCHYKEARKFKQIYNHLKITLGYWRRKFLKFIFKNT